MASHHFATFGGQRHCGSGIVMVLVCYGISQDHEIKESCKFLSWSPLWQVTTLPSLVAIGIVAAEI